MRAVGGNRREAVLIILPPVIGHRGAAGLAPENTLASFRRAAALGVGMVEFDVRLSADDQPVVFHDETLERTSDGRGRVADCELADLRALDASGWFAPGYAGETIPTLDEVLGLCLELGMMVNIEIKPDSGREARTAAIALTLARELWPADRPSPLVSSFAEESLAVAREAAPDWPRGLLVEAVPDDWRERARRLGCGAVCADHQWLRPAQVAEIRAAGMPVLAYTVNDDDEKVRLWAMGVAAVFSDFPYSR